jgi:TonB family protein
MATKAKKPPAPKAPPKPAAPVQPVGPQPKILRIGVIQAGKIIEERLIRQRVNVTIGASARNTIVVPASSLPRSLTLFEIQGGKYSLKFNDAMDGRVSVGNQVLSLDQIRQQNLAPPKGGMGTLSLTEQSRGKVLLGEVTLLFQFVTPPPIQPRPQLPPSVRGGFFANMDWALASSFITLAVIHFGFLLYLRTTDFPKKIDPDVIPDRFAEYIPEVKKPQTIDLNKLSKVGEKAAEKVDDPGPKKGGGGGKKAKGGPAKPCDAACQEARAAARRARLAEQVSKMGVLKLLGTTGKGAGATANLLGSGDPGTDTDKAFQGVGGVTVAGRGGKGGGLRGKGGGGTGKGVGIGDLGGRVGGPGQVGTGGAVTEKVPKAMVKQSRAEIDGTMNTDAVARTIRLGMPAITACYQRALKRNPKLTGKVVIRLSINTMGAVTRVAIDSDSIGDPQVTSCIQGYAQRWRFPPPEGGSAEVAVPFVFQASQ